MSDVKKASAKNLVMIGGQEDLLRTRALSGILAQLNLLPDDFDVQNFDAQASTPQEWKGAVDTAPFLGERRVAIVRHLLQRDPPKESKGLFASLPNTAMLILVADPVGGSDDRRARAKTLSKSWEKIVADAKGSVLVYDPDPKTARDGVKAEVVARNIAISERAIDMLVEMTGASVSRSVEELDKLTLFVGASETIGERHLEMVVTPSRDWNVFKLTDSIFENNPPEAIRQLRVMIGNVSNAENAAFSQILPQIARLLKLIWQARVSLDMGVSLRSPTESFSKSLPAKPNLLTVAPFQQTKVLRMAGQTNLDSLAKGLQLVADCDAKLKGSLPSFSSIDSLEMMVLELTALMNKRR